MSDTITPRDGVLTDDQLQVETAAILRNVDQTLQQSAAERSALTAIREQSAIYRTQSDLLRAEGTALDADLTDQVKRVQCAIDALAAA